MKPLTYTRITSEKDPDLPLIAEIYHAPETVRYLSVGDNYFYYVTHAKNVFFYKIRHQNELIGSIHLEKDNGRLEIAILVFPAFQRRGYGRQVLEDLKGDLLGLDYRRLEASVDEKNEASVRLFEAAGFTCFSKEEELMLFTYDM